MESILLIRYSALGDVVLATSVLEPLRRAHPRARVEWVTSPAYAPLLEGLPGVAAVHPLGRGGVRAALALARALRGRFEAHRSLARVTLPLWLWVSVSGVVVYWMLYRL